MSEDGLEQARTKMTEAGIDPAAIDVFAHYYRLLDGGETGMVPESTIEPLDMESLEDVDVDQDVARRALAETVVIKLNGGLGTSMGMDRAKALLEVRDGMSFLDIIARQVLALRKQYDVPLPLVFMNSFRTRDDTLEALGRYPKLVVSTGSTSRETNSTTRELPLDFLQNKEPKLRADDLTPVTWDKEPALEWCPPGHGDLYTALRGTGLLDLMIDGGFKRVFVANSDNLGAVADPRVAGWFAQSDAPFAIEAVRRTPSDRKGGHFATRKTDGRIVLRESAQTLDEDKEALADLDRHRFASTNNLWFDLRAMRDELDRRDGILGLSMIKNTKTVDPADPNSPEVIQIETAMGAAIEVFDGARTIEVGRDRFVPVKTTNDLLVLRSDCYRLRDDYVLDQIASTIPFVDLDPSYFKLVARFDERFPDDVPSLQEATSLRVHGDWVFGSGVKVVGDAVVEAPEGTERGRIKAGSRLGES